MTNQSQRHSEPSPERLFQAYRNGDEAALGELVRQLSPWLAATARRAGARSSEIEEVVQDTWIAATAAAEDFRPDAPLLPWLATLVRHRLISLRRAHRRRARLHLLGGQRLMHAQAPGRSTDVTALARGREAVLAVRKAVAMLPPQYHDVLHLHLFEDLSPVQIADRLGLGRVTVRVRLFRGLRRLRRALPDALALLLLAALSRPARSQVPVAMGAAAMVTASMVCLWFLVQPGSAEPSSGVLTPSNVVAAEASPPGPRTKDPTAEPLQRTAFVASPALTVRVRDAAGNALAGVGITVTADSGGDPLLLDRHAPTTADGAVSFHTVPSGRLFVRSDRGPSAIVDITNGSREVELRAPGGIDVRGRIVAGTGAPVGNASIWLASADDGPMLGVEVATSGVDGSFELCGVAKGSFLAVRASGFASSPARTIDDCDLGTLVLTAPGGGIDVAVADVSGRPIADAVVVVGHRDARTWIPQVEGEQPTLPPPHRLRSDDRGRCLAIGLAPGLQPLLVRSPHHAPFHTYVAVEAGATTSVTAIMPPGAQLRGRIITADGTPLGGARVACRADDVFACVDAETAPDGTFCFEALPAGRLGLLAWMKDGTVAERVLTLPLGETTVEMPVELPRQRQGLILTSAGSPLPGWEVALPLPEPRSTETPYRFATADQSGRFILPVVPAVPWQRLLMRPPGSPYWTEVGTDREDRRDGSMIVRVAPEKLPAAALSARVVTTEGLALANAPVHFLDDADKDSLLGTTDADGRFEFGQVPAGNFRYFLESPCPDLPGLDLVTLAAVAGETRHYDIVVPAVGQVLFSLRLPNGAVPRAPVISIVRNQPHHRSARLHAPTGTQALAPGDYTLTAIGADFVWRIEEPFTVHAGQTTTLELALRSASERQFSLSSLALEHRGGILTGRFVDADTGQTLYRFATPVDQAFPLPLVSYLPMGRMLVEATTAAGRSLRAHFEVTDLVPCRTAQVLEFESVR